jgi:catechol 2,3-dioxygenase-like lactoylglutathione lyase family enzyme
MASVRGIGGAFLYSRDAAALAAWYRDILGVETEALPGDAGFYRVFRTRDAESRARRENPVFAIHQTDEELPSNRRAFMINLRVDDLHAFLARLRGLEVKVEDRVLEWAGGRHAWIHDPEGNCSELYEEILGAAAQ